MENTTWKQTIIRHLLVIAFFLVLALIYCSPLLEGKVIIQSDVIQAKGMQHEIGTYYEETGELSLWTNSMFGGMPTFQIWTLYKSNLISYVIQIFKLNLPIPVYYILWYLVSFYFLLISFRLNTWLSIIGAIAFAFSSYNFIILDAGHIGKAHAITHLVTVLMGVLLCVRGKYLLGGALTAFFFAIEIRANHLQITYYLMLMILILFIIELIYSIKGKQFKSLIKSGIILIIAAVLAILTNTAQLWSTYEYSSETIRAGKSELLANQDESAGGLDKDYALRWSYGITETFTLLIPNFYGGSSNSDIGESSKTYKKLISSRVPRNQAKQFIKQSPTYWGDQPFTSGPVYFGSIVCFLFTLGLFLVRGPIRWWIISVTVLSVLLSWGKNFPALTNIVFDYFPLYNKFRVVSTTLVMAQVTFPLLGFLALKEIFEGNIDKQKVLKATKVSLYIVGGICLFFILFSSAFFDFKSNADSRLPEWLIDAIRADRNNLLRMDALRSLIFILLSFGLIWTYLKKKLQMKYVLLGLGALILVDMWAVDKRYLNNEAFQKQKGIKNAEKYLEKTKTAADAQILQDKDPNFRVLNLTTNTFNDALTSFFHKSVGGYHGAKLRRYQELIEYHISKNNIAVLNMLNTKYFIIKPQEGNQPIAQSNPQALGNVWFINEYKIVENADEEIIALSNFNPAQTAIIDKRYSDYLEGLKIIPDPSAYVSLVQYKPNHLVYESHANKEQLAVFSEIYYNSYKGWQAYIDGQPVPHIRVNYVLRAIRVPAGKHRIDFKFKPRSYYLGEKISLASSIILLLICFLVFFVEFKKELTNKKLR